MKKFQIHFMDCGSDKFELLENSCSGLDVVDKGQFYLNDMATGARVLSHLDTLEFYATPEQETFLKITFGDKILEKS